MLDISPFIRIGLYLLAGYLGGLGVDPEAVGIIKSDPDLLASITVAFTLIWYALARHFGWGR